MGFGFLVAQSGELGNAILINDLFMSFVVPCLRFVYNSSKLELSHLLK